MCPQRMITNLLLFIAVLCTPSFALDQQKALSIGDRVPNVNANDHNGDLWRMEDHTGQGKYLVVYFYPAAMTGGCTKQACAYRDDSSTLKELGIQVVGVSADAVKNLLAFHQAENLNFPLLSDVNGMMAKLFGVPMKKGGSIKRNVQGKETTLARSYTTARWTFIIDKQGRLVHKDQQVNAAKDSEAAIQFIRGLQ